MKKLLKRIIQAGALVVTFICAGSGAIASEFTTPGSYVTEGNGSTMTVSKNSSDSSLQFRIYTTGTNGHECELEGEIQNSQANMEDQCVIHFEQKEDRVSVVVPEENNAACHRYCGARAWFAGDYFPVIPRCQQTKSVRAEFLQSYKALKYVQARDVLIDYLQACERFTDWYNVAEIRNDLAITQFHLGDAQACLKSLEPIKRTFIDDPELTGRVFTPLDEEWGEKMVKVSRFNWQKCGGK